MQLLLVTTRWKHRPKLLQFQTRTHGGAVHAFIYISTEFVRSISLCSLTIISFTCRPKYK